MPSDDTATIETPAPKTALTDADVPAVTLHLTQLFDELRAEPRHVATVATHLLVIATHAAGISVHEAEQEIVNAFRKGHDSLMNILSETV